MNTKQNINTLLRGIAEKVTAAGGELRVRSYREVEIVIRAVEFKGVTPVWRLMAARRIPISFPTDTDRDVALGEISAHLLQMEECTGVSNRMTWQVEDRHGAVTHLVWFPGLERERMQNPNWIPSIARKLNGNPI